MDATIHITGKKVVKVLGAVCLATGVVALSAVVASGAAVGAVAEGFRSAKNTMRNIMKGDEKVAEGEVLAKNADESMATETEGNLHETAADKIITENSNITDVTAEEL